MQTVGQHGAKLAMHMMLYCPSILLFNHSLMRLQGTIIGRTEGMPLRQLEALHACLARCVVQALWPGAEYHAFNKGDQCILDLLSVLLVMTHSHCSQLNLLVCTSACAFLTCPSHA